MDRERAMYPEIFKEAKQGDVSCLPEIQPRNRTEEDTVMRMDPKLYKAANRGDEFDFFLFRITRQGEEDSGTEFCLRRTENGNNILHLAARAGGYTFVAEALKHFPDLSHQVNSQGDTPLLVAARFGHLKVVEILMANPVETRTDSSQTDVEQGLVDHRLDVLVKNSEQGTTAIHEALRKGHEDVARYLLGLYPEMATYDSRAGESPLFFAAESRCQRFVEDILRSEWPYSTKGPDGQNALHAARNCDGREL